MALKSISDNYPFLKLSFGADCFCPTCFDEQYAVALAKSQAAESMPATSAVPLAVTKEQEPDVPEIPHADQVKKSRPTIKVITNIILTFDLSRDINF
jgi:hypothetical protein